MLLSGRPGKETGAGSVASHGPGGPGSGCASGGLHQPHPGTDGVHHEPGRNSSLRKYVLFYILNAISKFDI